VLSKTAEYTRINKLKVGTNKRAKKEKTNITSAAGNPEGENDKR